MIELASALDCMVNETKMGQTNKVIGSCFSRTHSVTLTNETKTSSDCTKCADIHIKFVYIFFSFFSIRLFSLNSIQCSFQWYIQTSRQSKEIPLAENSTCQKI